MALTESQIARLIDHTLLKPEASRDDIQKLCDEALEYGFASVCVNAWNVSQAAELLRDSEVRVCSVVGFPLGATAQAPPSRAHAKWRHRQVWDPREYH